MINEEILTFLKALSNEKRMEIVLLFLSRNEVTVNQVAEIIGIGQSTASEQLAILKRAGLLLSRKEGTVVYYSPNKSKAMELLQKLTSVLTDCCK
ncbi:ArsR/SmtB family transcription factor [Heyndrickxia oleronia]|uniref:Metalloregulator ArsR/SmtB family transcription factor n=1 Tax=Heyndrickxia oleronia TaxID=38875 RepID=A0AAW6SYU5_9BACI|nr:metalloregulator ArsR/SmtB family transcription factor [Heyndrickxia oleronia]MDH5163408.1 metalloregulator ArsR/SmtB family transcription factor [Heyndrickxia oleronia]